jgi:hypothetical protein
LEETWTLTKVSFTLFNYKDPGLATFNNSNSILQAEAARKPMKADVPVFTEAELYSGTSLTTGTRRRLSAQQRGRTILSTCALIAIDFKEKAAVLIDVSQAVWHGFQCPIELSQMENAAT